MPVATARSSRPGSLRDMVNKTTNPRAAEEIVAALSTPGRQARLRRWTPEFLEHLGDVPDPEECLPVRRPGLAGRRHPALPVQHYNRDNGARSHQAARHGR